MKTHKIFKIMLMALMLLTVSLSITSIGAEAKAYKAKTVTVTSGKSKTVKTSKKIKKVAICSTNKNFTVKKTGDKKFKVSGTDKGKTQTVKVTYTNKYTQKFKIKTKAAAKKTTTTMPSYAKKIVNELKPLLADPDKGLQTVLAQWEKKLGYECDFKLVNPMKGTTSYFTLDEVIKKYTASQKKALTLEIYFSQRMTYGLDGHKRTDSYWYNRNSNAFFKLLYEGKFWGYCDEGAAMAYDICQYLNIKAYYVRCKEINHAWTSIWVTDKNGTSYWHGIDTTSAGYNLKASVPVKNNLTKKQVETNYYDPQWTYIRMTKKQSTNKPATTPKAVTTTPSVTTTTQVPQIPAVTPTPVPTQTTTTVVFNTPEPYEKETPIATTEPTKAPAASTEPQVTQTPTPAPTQTPVTTPEPTVTPAPQRILIPHAEHNYTCAGCNPLNPPPVRHTNNANPYITNSKTTHQNYVVYKHVIGTEVRWFDADGNEYIDINNDGSIIDELIKLAG